MSNSYRRYRLQLQDFGLALLVFDPRDHSHEPPQLLHLHKLSWDLADDVRNPEKYRKMMNEGEGSPSNCAKVLSTSAEKS